MENQSTGTARTKPPEPVSGLSVVVPILNEIGNLPRLHAELTAALTAIGKDYEIILVDDGSTDGSTQAMQDMVARDPHVRLVVFRRNYGQTAAMKAGMDHARMPAIVTIDGDLQNDPADIAAMVARLEEGYDLVLGWRQNRQDAAISRKLPSRIANRLIARVTRVKVRDLGCTLKVMRREFLRELELYGDMHRFIPILMAQRGARWTEVATHHRPRTAGTTKYGIGRTIVVLLDLITVKYLLDYSAHPMRLFGGFGLASLGLGVLSFLLTVGMKLIGGMDMTGNPMLTLTVVAVLAGVQLLSLGVLGEVLVRIYYGDRGRTHYTVRARVNVDPPAQD